MNDVLVGIFFTGFLFLLLSLLFYVFHRRLPYLAATIQEVSVTEKSVGNAIIVTVWIHFEVHDTKRCTTVVFSGYASRRNGLITKAAKVKDYYKDKQARYFHLPGLIRLGVLDGSITNGYLGAHAVLTAIFALLSGVIILTLGAE